jgi:DNA-binding SARP family transcriptional activator
MGGGKASGRGAQRRGDCAPAADERVLALNERDLRSVFERLPHGLAIIHRTGAVLAMNAAFERIVRFEPGTPVAGQTCCALLGCELPANGRLGGCVIDGLLASDAPVRDLPVELPAGAGTAWLSGAPLDGDRELVIVELRGAAPVAVPEETGSPPIRLRVLGRMQVETPEGLVSGGWVDERPGQLLKYLVAERGRVVPVEDIAEAIWPTAEFATINTVRHLVHVLRDRLEPDRRRARVPDRASCIVSSRGGYTLDQSCVAIDADEFADAATRALTAFSVSDEVAEPALEAALALFRGDFLADELYADWAHAERERLRELAERLLWALTDLALARQDIAVATTYSERLAALEPFDSDLQRQLIALLLRDGRRGRALRQYQAFALRLQRAFGERPDFALDELIREWPANLQSIEARRSTPRHGVRGAQ